MLGYSYKDGHHVIPHANIPRDLAEILGCPVPFSCICRCFILGFVLTTQLQACEMGSCLLICLDSSFTADPQV